MEYSSYKVLRRNFVFIGGQLIMNNETLMNILNDFNSDTINYEIIIIANTYNIKKETKQWNYSHALFDEFFSREEFAEISSAIYNIFGFVKVFYSEVEFVKYVIENTIDIDNTIVFNFSRDGIHEGKKSLIPAFCDLFGIKYTGSNAFVISLLRNKYVFSNFLYQLGVPVPNTCIYDKELGFISGLPTKGKKIIKCVNESASIGLTNSNIIEIKDTTPYEKIVHIMNTMKTNKVLIQDYIEGDECEVLVLKYKQHYYALDPIMLKIPNSPIITSSISNSYDYEFCLLSDNYNKELCNKIYKCAEKAAALLNIKTYARFDFRIDSDKNYLLFDIAGTPYTIKHSSINYIFKKYGLSYQDIYKTIVQVTKNID